MLPKNKRITTRIFSRFFRRCQKFRGKAVDILYYGNQPPSRFSVVIRKRDYKKAVDRNNLRRKIYDLLEAIDAPNVLSGGVFIVIFMGKSEFDVSKVKKDLQDFLVFHQQK